MKNIAVIALLVGFVGSSATAGTVSFGSNADVVIDPGAGESTIVEFSLTVTDAGIATGFDSVNVVVGSNNLAITGFSLDPTGVSTFFTTGAFDDGTFASGWAFGYFGSATSTPNNQFLGTLTVDAAGLDVGTYFVTIDNELDDNQSKLTAAANVEPLFGGATITIVPEPATLALLGIGGLVTALRRRRTA